MISSPTGGARCFSRCTADFPLRGKDLERARGRCQTSVQGLLNQSRCARHWDVLVVLNLWSFGLGFGDDRSGLRDRLGLWGGNSDWFGVRGWCAVWGTHLY